MRVLITNKALRFGEDAIIEDALSFYGGYTGYCNDIRVTIAIEDGAIIVEDSDAEMDQEFR